MSAARRDPQRSWTKCFRSLMFQATSRSKAAREAMGR